MAIITKARIFKVIQWMFFSCLVGLAAYFMVGVLQQYYSKSTSFSQFREPLAELPTITMCFVSSLNGVYDENVVYKYYSDFNIEYEVEWGKSIGFLKFGNNFNQFNETVNLEKLDTSYNGDCYKISATFDEYIQSKLTTLILYFNKSIPDEKLPSVKTYITSENNAYGVITVVWSDGKVTQEIIEKYIYKQINVRSQQTNYLPKVSNCNNESFWECFEQIFDTELVSCPDRCTDFSLPSNSIPNCEPEMDSECSVNVYWKVFGEMKKQKNNETVCPQACKVLEYFKEETWRGKVSDYYRDKYFS